MSDTIAFENHRFGPVEVRESDVLHFPGLPGFPRAQRFVVMEHDRDSLFAWLVCVDDPDLAFAITDPSLFFPDYRPPVELRHLKALRVEKPEDLVIMTIVSFAEQKTSLNLLAPLLINASCGRGQQMVFDRCEYSAHQELPAPQDATGGASGAQDPEAGPESGSS